MAQTPRDKLEYERGNVEDRADEGDISEEAKDAILEWSDALDEATVRNKYRDEDGDVKGLRPGTVLDYTKAVRLCCDRDFDPTGVGDVEDVNDFMDALHDDHGLSKGTCAKYQCALKTFYRYHDLGVDPEAITTFTPDSSPKHDEQDMFTDDEVQALRQACGDTRNAVRNRAFLELLIFTGQRVKAVLTLRLKDVDDGYIYLNEDYDDEFGGLKGALARGRKRPIFGARKYVRDYINLRRSGADPDDWLFVGDPSHPQTDPDGHWSEGAVEGTLNRLAESAGVDKPVNPHNFRHYCATVMKRDHDVDPATIKMLFGHVEGSDALEKTYQHLFDADYIEKAEVALGVRDEDDGPKSFTPDICPTCGELLEEHWRRCPSCDEVFGPSEDFAEQLDEARDRARDEGMSSLDPDTVAVAQAISEAGADPAGLAETLAALDD